MTQRAPRVSIGMPVRNGERFIRQTIDSLLSQTFEDFELIICDNASTDHTAEICREYERRDPRVRYHRNPRDIGPAGNHNECFALSRGEYFRWHAHDDLCLPTYLEKCVAVLDADPGIVNCHSHTRVIDEHGDPLWDYDFRTSTGADRAGSRYGGLINVSHRRHVGYEIFGLMRREVMATTPLEEAYTHGDRVFLVRMSLRGRFYEIPEFLFEARRHASQSMSARTGEANRPRLARLIGPGPLPPPEWWDASKKGRIAFPDWNLVRQYFRAVGEVPMSFSERLRCRLHLGRWLVKYWPKLARDLAFAGEKLVMRAVGNGNSHDDHHHLRPEVLQQGGAAQGHA
jgi:glycosyltransferase involved in cell wall biosynthesis